MASPSDVPKETKSVPVRSLKDATKIAANLESWFHQNKRDLPWRINRDPYRIWVSEVMLQQTTVKAVIPFYLKFMARFPDLEALATAELTEVYTYWSGLGYYSRARNLLKAAQALHAQGGFPKTHLELQEFPGFGPYTSRAVSSQAFSENVGVVDGNVIRVLSRISGEAIEFWTEKGRGTLQTLADQIVTEGDPSTLNQSLMELGATVCTPVNPTCMLCPVNKQCIANREGKQNELPLKKPRKSMQLWQWKIFLPHPLGKNTQIPILKNNYAPFLKGAMVFPGTADLLKKKPSTKMATHTVTHHKIYLAVEIMKPNELKKLRARKDVQWISVKKLAEVSPHKILQKALDLIPTED